MKIKFLIVSGFCSIFFFTSPLFPTVTCYAGSAGVDQDCLQNLFETGPDNLTMGEARRMCAAPEPKQDHERVRESVTLEKSGQGVITERLEVDQSNIRKPFTLMSHRNNYILLGAYNTKGWNAARFAEAYDKEDLEADDLEVEFQLSIKTPLAIDMFDSGIDLFAAYTVRSHWQFYNSDMSSPFRETNHEPEAWLQMQPENLEIFGFTNTVNGVGINHMSNGQGGLLSRSWNRVVGFFSFEKDNLAVMFRPWIRIEESLEDDDNTDITDFYGHGELWLAYTLGEHTFSFMSRNNLESGFSKGAVELGWSFPLFGYPYLKGYIQYFSGYGASLIDYNQYVNQIGIGIQLTDVL